MDDFRIPSDSLTEQRVGAIATVTTESGDEYRARVVSIEGDTALVHPFEKLTLPTESSLFITLVQALPKKEKMEWIIQKATELGVSAIVPCTSEKSIALEERDHLQAKSHRWQEIARKATEQSRRKRMPLVASCVAFEEALRAHSDRSINLILYEKETKIRLRDIALKGVENLTVVCGPEGGFSEREIESACRLDYTPCRLGGRILRCETAAIAALSIIQFVTGNL